MLWKKGKIKLESRPEKMQKSFCSFEKHLPKLSSVSRTLGTDKSGRKDLRVQSFELLVVVSFFLQFVNVERT